MTDRSDEALTVEVCSACGAMAGQGAHGHRDGRPWEWRRMEYVPKAEVDRLREAVRDYLNGAPLNEDGRFRDPRRETLYRAVHAPRAELPHPLPHDDPTDAGDDRPTAR